VSKAVSLDQAVALVPDGASIGTGGVLMTRKPVALLDAIGKARRDLTLWTMLGSVDAEVLAAHGALAASNTIYVGFEQLGFAPAYSAAIESGAIDARDWSEFLFMGGLRASIAGLPFLPTRGGRGSDVTRDLDLETVTCPYTGEELAAAPAIRPDVALLHAEVVDEQGNLPLPAGGDFLFDYDANIARASATVIVSVERIAPVTGPMLLYGHEVDAIVAAPGGARPSAVPGVYGPDLAAVRAYMEDRSLERLV
jgi:glutaconate CoA-transferase subunit A